MIDHFSEDTSISLDVLGLIVWMFYTERFTLEQAKERFLLDAPDAAVELAWNRLAAKGLLIETETTGEFMLALGAKKMTALEQQFEEFRKAFPGTKTGHDTMLKCLKKHKDWRMAIPLLMPTLEREKAHKAALESKRQRGENVHLPAWANLQTWLNQRRWEQEFPEYVTVQQEIKPAGRYGEYVNFMELTFRGLPYMLSFDQYESWCSMSGSFLGMDRRHSERTRKERFIQAHRELSDQPVMVAKAGGLFQRLVYLIQ